MSHVLPELDLLKIEIKNYQKCWFIINKPEWSSCCAQSQIVNGLPHDGRSFFFISSILKHKYFLSNFVFLQSGYKPGYMNATTCTPITGLHICCAFQPANGCLASCLLIKIIFFSILICYSDHGLNNELKVCYSDAQ